MVGLLIAAAGTAHAQVSSTWTQTSDYNFRGASQTAKDPALQGSLDFETDKGWYIGGWASNVDFGEELDADVEVDLYTGLSGEDENGLGWDAGFIYYLYPGAAELNYAEIYGKLSYEGFEAGLHYSNDWADSGDSALYLTGDALLRLPRNFSLRLHLGYSFGDYFDNVDSKYLDYSAGIGYTLGKFELALQYVDTDLDREDLWFSSEDVSNTEGRVIFSVTTSFPWRSE